MRDYSIKMAHEIEPDERFFSGTIQHMPPGVANTEHTRRDNNRIVAGTKKSSVMELLNYPTDGTRCLTF